MLGCLQWLIFILSFSLAAFDITTILVPVVSVIAIVAICGAVICVVAVYRRRSKCSCACSDLESVKPSTNEHEKSPSHHFVSQRIVADYHHETTHVCSNRPESICAQDLGDFKLPDREEDKKNSSFVWYSCIVICHHTHLVWYIFLPLYLVVMLLFLLSFCLLCKKTTSLIIFSYTVCYQAVVWWYNPNISNMGSYFLQYTTSLRWIHYKEKYSAIALTYTDSICNCFRLSVYVTVSGICTHHHLHACQYLVVTTWQLY